MCRGEDGALMGGDVEEAVGGNRRLDSPGNTGWDVATETQVSAVCCCSPDHQRVFCIFWSKQST